MKNCQLCGKELIHVEGRKQKSFCDTNCRNKYFYAQRKVLVEVGKKSMEVVVNDLTKPEIIKPVNTPTTNYSINTLPPMPIREKGEDSIDFGTRKNEWKKLYQK